MGTLTLLSDHLRELPSQEPPHPERKPLQLVHGGNFKLWNGVGAVADIVVALTGGLGFAQPKKDLLECAFGVAGIVGQALNWKFGDKALPYTAPLIALASGAYAYDGFQSGDWGKALTGITVGGAFTIMAPPVERFLMRISPALAPIVPTALLLASTGVLGLTAALQNSKGSMVGLGIGAALYFASNVLMLMDLITSKNSPKAVEALAETDLKKVLHPPNSSSASYHIE